MVHYCTNTIAVLQTVLQSARPAAPMPMNNYLCVWLSGIEINYYSIPYFDCVTAFECCIAD